MDRGDGIFRTYTCMVNVVMTLTFVSENMRIEETVRASACAPNHRETSPKTFFRPGELQS